MVSLTVSPSSLTIRRKTPWVAGCWGPKLTTYSSVPNWDSSLTLIWLNNKSVIGEILSQGKLGVILGHHDAAQVRVSLKSNAIKVKHFPFEPIGAFPDVFQGWRLGISTIHIQFDCQLMGVFIRPKMANHSNLIFLRIIHRRQAGEMLKGILIFISQALANRQISLGLDNHNHFPLTGNGCRQNLI